MSRYFGKDRINNVSIAHNMKFAFGKIGIVMLLLHIITTFANSVFLFIGQATNSIANNILRIFANLILVQEWIPMERRSINPTSWYLSTTLFCYFIFPYVLKLFEKKINVKKAIYCLGVLFTIQIAIGFLMSNFNNSYIEPNDFSYWIIYRFPITRSIDFIIGCILGYLSIHTKSTVGEDNVELNNRHCILSLATIVLVIVGNILFVIYKVEEPYEYMTNWWTYSVIFTISSCPLVYLASKKESLLSRMITNRLTVYLGNISPHIFLIHYVVFQYISSALSFFGNMQFVDKYLSWILLFVGIPVSVIATQIWMQIIKKIPLTTRST